MKQVKYRVCLLGVALVATSAFHHVNAQQSPNMLLEMQSMRAEIAELRDMVERQNYEINKLKRQLSLPQNRPVPNQTQAYPANNYPDNVSTHSNYPSNNQQVGTLPTAPNVSSAPLPSSVDVPELESGAVNSTGDSTVSKAPQYNNTNPDSSINQGDQAVLNNSAQQEALQEAQIEERTLNAPPIVNDQTYPPIDEVIIGQNTNQQQSIDQAVQTPENTQVFSGQTPQSAQQPAQHSTQYSTQQGQQQNTQGGGFIAVPNQPVAIQNAPGWSSSSAGQVNTQAPEGVAVDASNLPQQAPQYQNLPQPLPQNSTAAVNQNTLPPATPSAPTADAKAEQDYYQQGFDLLKKSKHDEAVTLFAQQIESYPVGDLADDAHYWIAESHYVNRKLDDSKRYFKIILDQYKQSPRLPDAMLKTAYIEQEQGNKIEARILLQEIVQFHPRSNAAISAKNRLAELK